MSKPVCERCDGRGIIETFGDRLDILEELVQKLIDMGRLR